jgi:uncharacterized membrane protein YphA (DoxX/SURF4 family)
MKRSTLIEIIIFLYTILFLYTGINKLLEYEVFKENLSETPLVGRIASSIALGLPLLEILVTIMLIIPRWRIIGLYAALALMAIFTTYVIAILLFDKKLPCSCGGIIQQLSWQEHLLFNITFILIALWGIALQKREKKQQQLKWLTR